MQRNPPQDLIDSCCNRCPLKPSKPGQEKESGAVIAAANAANRLEQLIQAGTAQLIYPVGSINPKLIAAHLALKNAQNKSDKKRMDELKKHETSNNKKPTNPLAYID